MTKDEPIAYIIGWQPFLGLKIYLNSRPLIPRPETEWWTEQLLTNLEVQLPIGSWTSKLRFLDLCAGSGATGCAALAKLSNAQVYFGEIDRAHKATILKNIHENNLDGSRAHICIGDLFEPFKGIKFDVIAANPPYIPENRKLPKSVADYEPALALYAGADGLDFIRRIAKKLPKHLAKNGIAWVECDSPTAETARALFESQNLNAKIKTDQYGIPRIIVVSFK
jgi:release factor glutamine methyltransferase